MVTYWENGKHIDVYRPADTQHNRIPAHNNNQKKKGWHKINGVWTEYNNKGVVIHTINPYQSSNKAREKGTKWSLYWAYGSNISKQRMKWRCFDAYAHGPLIVDKCRLVFRGVADVEFCEGETTAGVLWWISDVDEEWLDKYEGVKSGLYKKKYLPVTIDGVELDALFYQMTRKGIHVPTSYYLTTIREGYRDFNLDQTKLDAAVQYARDNIEETPDLYKSQRKRILRDSKREFKHLSKRERRKLRKAASAALALERAKDGKAPLSQLEAFEAINKKARELLNQWEERRTKGAAYSAWEPTISTNNSSKQTDFFQDWWKEIGSGASTDCFCIQKSNYKCYRCRQRADAQKRNPEIKNLPVVYKPNHTYPSKDNKYRQPSEIDNYPGAKNKKLFF